MSINAYGWLVIGILLASALTNGSPGASPDEKQAEKKRRQFITLACILLYVIYGLRNAFLIGGDSTSSYLHRFQDIEAIGTANWFAGNNWGFFLLMKIVSRLTGGDYQFFIALISAFIMIVLARFLRKYSTDPLLSVLCYMGLLLYCFMFSALKQSVAMSFVLLAFDGIVEKKPVKFIALVLIGSFFHLPALVFLPAYWLVKIGVGKNYLLTLAGMLVFVYLFRGPILNLMNDVYDKEVTGTNIQFFGTKVIIMILIVVAALLLRPPTKEDRIYNMLLAFTGVAIVFQTYCYYNNIFERLADYYFQFVIVFIPMVFDRKKKTTTPLSAAAEQAVKQWAPYGIGLFAIWRFLNYVQNCGSIFLPYKFFFQK